MLTGGSMAYNWRQFNGELPPVWLSTAASWVCFTGGTGLLHGRGRRAALVEANGFTVGVLELGRREGRSCVKGFALSSVGAKRWECPWLWSRLSRFCDLSVEEVHSLSLAGANHVCGVRGGACGVAEVLFCTSGKDSASPLLRFPASSLSVADADIACCWQDWLGAHWSLYKERNERMSKLHRL